MLPSNNHTDLTLSASGTTYTAPANEYYYLYGNSDIKADFAINFENVTSHFRECILGNNWTDWVSTYIPVKKGDIVKLLYNNITTSSHIFLFIYAEGQQSIIKY